MPIEGETGEKKTMDARQWLRNARTGEALKYPWVFGGSGFGSDKFGHAFVTESGPTYATGPQSRGKRISEFVIDGSSTNGTLVGTRRTLAHYTGNGKGTAVALAAGPGGLYFSDFYEDDPVNGVFGPTNAGANILRVVYAGT